MKVVIVGGGIGGLAVALSLHRRGVDCEVHESAPEVREIGVGITLLPHAMRELEQLGLQQRIEEAGIDNLESVFFNRFGQFVYREARGRHAGYAWPEIGIHRGKLHRVLYEEALQRLGAERIHLGRRCVGVEQDEGGATARFQDAAAAAHGDVVVACDGVNSAVRRQFYPGEQVAFTGINTWRGVTVHPPIMSGRSYLRIGTIATGKLVIYPIVDNVDGKGNQLINWVAEIRQDVATKNDWNKPGRVEDFLPFFAGWRFDWLDVTRLITTAQQIFEYPMVDKDPVPRWTFGRVTLLGDAAHPMYPRGSNGSAQALIDASVLADELVSASDPQAALQAYEKRRIEVTARIVQTNRTVPPDFIIMRADELSGGGPIAGGIDSLISQAELRRISEDYKRIAGFSLDTLKE